MDARGKVAEVCVCGLPAGHRARISVTVALVYYLLYLVLFGYDFTEYVADVLFQVLTSLRVRSGPICYESEGVGMGFLPLSEFHRLEHQHSIITFRRPNQQLHADCFATLA